MAGQDRLWTAPFYMKHDLTVGLNRIRFFNCRTVCVLSLAHHAGEHKGSQTYRGKYDAHRIGDAVESWKPSFAMRI